MTRGSFDSVAHLTRRVRRAEQRAEMLERLLAKTLRLLAPDASTRRRLYELAASAESRRVLELRNYPQFDVALTGAA